MILKQRDNRLANQSPAYQDDEQTEQFIKGHFEHTRDQLRERYGIIMTRKEWDALNQRIYDEVDVAFLFKPNYRTAVYKLKLGGRVIGVMFSTQMSCVTTAMPPEDTRVINPRPIGKR